METQRRPQRPALTPHHTEQFLLREEAQREIERLLPQARLSKREMEAWHFRRMEYKQKDIATLMQISRSTVGALLRRATLKFRRVAARG